MIPRWIKVWAGLGVFFIVVIHFLGDMTRNVEVAYAQREVFGLQRYRDEALGTNVPEAAKRLSYASYGLNMKQREGSPLDQVCNLQRTNVIRDIIGYLRTKTGEDLGNKPEPWIQKYAPKN